MCFKLALSSLSRVALVCQIAGAVRQPQGRRLDGADPVKGMLALFAATSGAQWTDNSGWNRTDGAMCDWKGVDCDPSTLTITYVGLILAGS